MPTSNQTIILNQFPKGKPTPAIFSKEKRKLAELKNGQFLIKNAWVAIDPALIGRIRQGDNYAEGVSPGQVMQAYAIGQVIKSKNNKAKIGELRIGRFDMQEYAIQNDPTETTVINTGLAPARYYLSIVGSTGLTAYFGLMDLCQPKKRETIVISAGGSSVGTIVAQLAKTIGCRTVGIVSTKQKAKAVKQKWDYDAVISYRNKSITEIRAALGKVCPDGVDIYYDNTSGDISEGLIGLYNDFARIAVIGRLGLSHLNHAKEDIGQRDNNELLVKRIKKQGFVLFDYKPRFLAGMLYLAKLVKQGKLTPEEDILEGIENLPAAFFRMINGENKGKQLVKVSEIDHSLDPTKTGVAQLLIANWFPTNFLIKRINQKKINA